MSFRKTLVAVVAVVALMPTTAHASTYRTLVGVASGEATIHTPTLQLGADMTVWLTHLGRVTARFDAPGTRTDGIVRAIGPFSMVAAGGDRITGTFTLNGVGPTLDPHPIGLIMTITGGTGRFTSARGTLVAAPMMTPRTPFTPPVLFERAESAVHGFIDY